MTREGFQFFISEVIFLLDAKAVAHHIQMDGCHLVDRIVVAAFLPSRMDAKPFAEGGNLAAWGNAATLGDTYTHEVDEAFGDERCPFMGIDEKFTHCLGRGALLADMAVPADLFW